MRRLPTLLAPIALLASALLMTGCSGSSHSAAPTTPSATTSGAISPLPTASQQVFVATLRKTPGPWDRPATQDVYVQAAGLSLTPQETLSVHYHAHLDVVVDGKSFPVPGGLGINANADGTLPPHGTPGIAPLHTHDISGILHIEAPQADTFTLGQVFTEWGVYLSATQVGSYQASASQHVLFFVNGKPFTTDPTKIVLSPHEEIAVLVSSDAHPTPPSSFTFPTGD